MRIRVIDLETTGFTPPEAAICEIGFVDVASTATDLSGLDCDFAVAAPPTSIFCNPGHPIPPETSAVHHIVDADVEAALHPDEALTRFVREADATIFVAHNAKFERQFIPELWTGARPWICTYKCALRLWPDAPNHQNQTLRYFLKPPGLDRSIACESHRAGPDAYVTAFTLVEALKLAPVERLIQWTNEPAILPRVTFGQHRGKRWSEVDDGFLRWVSARDFDEDVLHTVMTEINRRDAERRAGRL